MTKPLEVVIPHQLGLQEAKRRLKTGFGDLKTRFGDKLTSVDDRWSGDHLDIDVRALGQAIAAGIDVGENQVRVVVELPWLLAMVAEKAKGLIEREGSRLLIEKK